MLKKINTIEEIIKDCIKNRNRGKETMYKLFYGYLMGIILRYCKNIPDNEELVNDCFIKIFKALPTFKPPVSEADTIKYFKSWIAKIASRTAIDKIKLSKMHLFVDELSDLNHPVTDGATSSSLNAKDILKLLDKLPDLHRVIFNLYEIEGFKHDEIADLLKIPESSSRVYLTRAKERLRKLYIDTEIQLLKNNERRIN